MAFDFVFICSCFRIFIEFVKHAVSIGMPVIKIICAVVGFVEVNMGLLLSNVYKFAGMLTGFVPYLGIIPSFLFGLCQYALQIFAYYWKLNNTVVEYFLEFSKIGILAFLGFIISFAGVGDMLARFL